jgi:trans-aconitate methyltransferase
MSQRFNARYYQRFYMNPRTRAVSEAEIVRRADMVAAVIKQLELPVKRILDAGCGLGWFRAPLLTAWPAAAYTGLEVSEYLCREHGWVNESLTSYRPRGRFDLIICHDVLQYLSDRQCAQALANLARWSRGALYLHVPTAEDWRDNVDHGNSDNEVVLRDAGWYRSRLARHFDHAGFGIHIRHGVPWGQWALERG